jgi:hypothetical protein
LSLAASWIKSTFICANVLCHRNGLVLTCTCVPKTHPPCIHLGLVQPQLVLPHLQAMYYGEELFLMNWPSPLTTIELHALICNGHPPCINTPPMPKSLTPVCTSKGLTSFANLSTGGEDNLFLSSPKAW